MKRPLVNFTLSAKNNNTQPKSELPKSHVRQFTSVRSKIFAAMTLEGEYNRPNTAEEEEDLEAIAEEDNQPLAQVLEPPEEPAEHIEAATEEPLFPNLLPDFTPSIEEINRSLNIIQEEINQLSLRPEAETQQAEDTDADVVDEFENAYKDLDKNLNNIDEVLTKLDQDNDLLQEKLRTLLNSIRCDSTNDQQ